MSIERFSSVTLLAAILLAVPASGQDFNERYAAWQGRGPAPRRQVKQASMQVDAPPPSSSLPPAPTVPAPAASAQSQNARRVLSDTYDVHMHTPDYNNPWTSSQCASCNHGPTYVPHSDDLGACNYLGGGMACGADCCGHGGCGGCGPCGGAGGGVDWGPLCCNTLVWLRADVLLWWRQGRDYPIIVTSDPAVESSTTAGVLPNAQTLLGGRVGTDMQAGGRVDFGFFMDPRQCSGYGIRVWGLGRDSSESRFNSNDTPVLAIPFFDADADANDALLISFPGLRTGTVAVTGTSSVFSHDVYGRYLLCRDCNNRLDFITGWQYARLADNLDIRSQSRVTEVGGTIPVGTVSTVVDQFDTRNEFHGAILGLQWERNCTYWTMRLLGRMSIGNMHERSEIAGSSRITSPGQTTQNLNTGLFAAASNIGRQSRDEFTAITEVGCNIAYRFAPCTQLTLGYNFIYFSDVLSPGTGIDRAIGDTGAAERPQFTFRHSDYWIQGLCLGLSKEF